MVHHQSGGEAYGFWSHWTTSWAAEGVVGCLICKFVSRVRGWFRQPHGLTPAWSDNSNCCGSISGVIQRSMKCEVVAYLRQQKKDCPPGCRPP